MERMLHFIRDESGASAVEYGLLLALIAMAAAGSISIFGAVVRDRMFGLADTIFPR